MPSEKYPVFVQEVRHVLPYHFAFLREHDDEHRVSSDAYTHYMIEMFGEYKQKHILLEAHTIDGGLIGLSFAYCDSWRQYSVTVVSKYYRRRGIGEKLLKAKTLLLDKCHILYETQVDVQNTASVKMCRKVFDPARTEDKSQDGKGFICFYGGTTTLTPS